ncbi:MAG: DUF5114 domain-containing protein [Muribaculaceae bacterium]|nr:DUF5114 domain-containing protein [Muribaculaceae bacterium]
MKLHKYIPALCLATLALASCEKDGDTIYANGITDTTVGSQASDIVLDADRLDALALSVYWNDNGDISLSDPGVAAPSQVVSNTVQFATDETFAATVDDNLDTGIYFKQYTCRSLNNIMSRLGLEGGVKSTVYVRVKSTLGVNIEPVYSNVLTLTVTPYLIDMTVGFYLDEGQNDTGIVLSSPEANGVYTGFVGAPAWGHFWLREGNGTIWGNDGVTGTAFVLGNSTTGNDIWNCWYPGVGGCYYVTVDTPANEWSALLIPEITVSGDYSGTMSYDRNANQWSMSINAPAAGSASFTLATTGKLYNAATGTDDAAAIDTPMYFGIATGVLSFSSSPLAPVAVELAAGDNTLILDLNKPGEWSFATGEVAPVVDVPARVYLPGITEPWDFATFLNLYDEDNRTYGGVNYVNSEWGYQIAVEEGNWGDVYTMVAGGTAFDGKLEFQGENNITAPAEGIYLFDVSLSGLSYRLTPVTSVSYSGLNDDWNVYPMDATDEPCVFTAEVTKTANTPWGVKILLNGSWDLFFGGNGTPGELALYRDGFEGDNDFPEGTVLILTVDLAKGTYSYTAK